MQVEFGYLSKEDAGKPEGYYHEDRAELLEFVPRGAKRILDVGSGSGNFGELVKKNINCVYWGIEPDRQAAEEAGRKLDKVINDVFSENLPEIENQLFDVICFNDVLEHLINPEDALIQCKKYLKENGIVLASIPNILFFSAIFEILVEQDWQYQDSGVLDKTHLRFFTKKSIARMFETCGYEIIKIKGINSAVTRKYKLLNFLLFNHLKDWKYLQFVVQARVK
jgi:2-polyprenyl-3-methyl-5-hydroxy-6-metoxy-1,4-benzoquinol methylase